MTRYCVIRERAHDWRVWTVTLSGSRGECVSMHATRNGAVAAMRRLYSARVTV